MEKQTMKRHFRFEKRGRYKTDLTIVKLTIQIVCKYFNITEAQLLGQRRFTKTATARKFAMYLIYENTAFNYSEIGELFHKDHTTILAAVKSVRGYKQVNDPYIKPLLYIQQNYFIN